MISLISEYRFAILYLFEAITTCHGKTKINRWNRVSVAPYFYLLEKSGIGVLAYVENLFTSFVRAISDF